LCIQNPYRFARDGYSSFGVACASIEYHLPHSLPVCGKQSAEDTRAAFWVSAAEAFGCIKFHYLLSAWCIKKTCIARLMTQQFLASALSIKIIWQRGQANRGHEHTNRAAESSRTLARSLVCCALQNCLVSTALVRIIPRMQKKGIQHSCQRHNGLRTACNWWWLLPAPSRSTVGGQE